ncbi:hypothetical protein OsJ_26448 [Oryza sativa Japonica Group]|uniref:Disease resistance N-terminal domain-containing protein n=1 Tax=Oryza sativa subsp. japonica TaxID=39947 RepID=B9FZM8_ORYSJ|nr:hypothetical protein OsJ_26448 [Oryza sativa Japonica Group]
MAVYSVATGALAPVLSKLSALLGDEHLDLAERTRSDAMFIRSQLEAVHSLLLPRISWGMTGEEVDALCKDELMAEVRELSYDMDDAIDEFFLEEPMAGGDGGPFDELKTRVEDVSKRFSDSRRARRWRAAPMAVYSVATGALAPVLSKLSALLGDEHLDLAERTRSDAMFIRSQLEAVHSLLLPRISWGMTGEEVDALCKDELMAEVRELSYDMDDAIDEFFLEEPMAGGDGGPFDELKTRVEDVSKRFSDSRRWRPPDDTYDVHSVYHYIQSFIFLPMYILALSVELAELEARRERVKQNIE